MTGAWHLVVSDLARRWELAEALLQDVAMPTNSVHFIAFLAYADSAILKEARLP